MNIKKIYIAEDNPLHINLLETILKGEENYEVIFFTDGLELYQQTLKEKPDMLILDIILPSLAGLAITRLLKFHARYRDIPILVTSSITDPDIKERAIVAGADVFIPKPFQKEDLFNNIERLLHEANH